MIKDPQLCSDCSDHVG